MLRISGGEFRGRMIHTPSHGHTRPTQARLRQALFNSLQTEISDARVLDLFAGSGALGIEALSWGASEVTFVESDRSTAKLIEKNANELKIRDRVRIISDSVSRAWLRLAERKESFDIILADPPYAEGWETQLLEKFPWETLLGPKGLFVLEWGKVKSQVTELPEQLPFLVKVREKIYGDSVLTTFQKREPDGEQNT